MNGSILEDSNIAPQGVRLLPAPTSLKSGVLSMTERAKATVLRGRQEIVEVLAGQSSRLIAIVGPCSIHDPAAALEYAGRLAEFSSRLPALVLVMRTYFEKPRTTTGWKGLLVEPDLGNGFELERGLRVARKLLIGINELGLPAATEFLDPIVPQYLADLIAWGAIGARTTESQTHRQMASGLSMPVGFKNGTDGNVQQAVDGIIAARTGSSFLGISSSGRTASIRTTGNPWGHLILRGGSRRPNYYARDIAAAAAMLDRADPSGCITKILVDCSHANSRSARAVKDHTRQARVLRYIASCLAKGDISRVAGLMLESNLFSGNQKPGRELKYGVSITDPCIGWEETEQLLLHLQDAVA